MKVQEEDMEVQEADFSSAYSLCGLTCYQYISQSASFYTFICSSHTSIHYKNDNFS